MIAGGGTGGHVLAGVAVADAWREAVGPNAQIVFVGARGAIEERLVPRAGYKLEVLSIGSLNKVSFSRRIKTGFQLPIALLKSMGLLLSFRPQAVIGVGGYAAGPLVLMARFAGLGRIRTAVIEQNSVPGFTNRVLGRFVQQVFCAFPGTERWFTSARVTLTGNPIRNVMKPMGPASRDPFTIFVFGGSQGALGMNTIVIEALGFLPDLKDRLRWIHQTGEADFERVAAAHVKAGFSSSRVEKFIYEMPAAYAQASLLICRAGSSTLSEIAAVGRAAVLFPLPTAADNHQEKNARVFSDVGAAVTLPQRETRGEDLARVIRELVSDSAKIAEMESRVQAFYRPEAARDIVRGLLS